MKTLAMIIALVCISLLSVGCSTAKTYGPYNGKIVDAETKDPIEGAAVLVVFYANEPGPAGSITRYADAVETLTDKNGEFRIPEHMVTSEKRRYFLDSNGYFTIFKPGYGHYPESKGVRPIFVPNGTLPKNQFVTVELPKLKTKEEIEKSMSPRVRYEIPYRKQKYFISLINQWNELVGIAHKETEDSFEKEKE